MKLSVVVPVYNEERTLAAIVDRILGAAPPAREVLLVDDGSRTGARRSRRSWPRRTRR